MIWWNHFKTRENPGSNFSLEKVLKELLVKGRIALLQTKSDQDSELYNFEIGKSLKLPLQMCLKFICERLGLIPKRWQADSTTQLHLLRNTTPFIIRCFSASNQHSFTVSYLVNSCGLSPETAISASEKIHFENPKNPDSVLALLRNSGCTNTHITKIVTKLPSLLLVDPEKTLLPKLEFFCSMGFSSARVASMLSPDPSLLGRSLEKVLIPKYNFLKSVDISNEDAIKVLRRSSWSSSGNLERNIAANIAVLRETGVPISRISYLVTRYHAISLRSDKFSENVKKVVEMGFNPLKFTFLDALQAFCQTTESTRQQKMEMYRRWGWSEDEILSAFRRRPQCMQLSEKKVNKVLDFLVNKMGWQPAVVARAPVAICLNFEKRVVPRCSVVKVLLLKGLIKKDLKLGTFLNLPVGDFLDKYVIKYEDDIPQLLDVYQGKVSFMELEFGA